MSSLFDIRKQLTFYGSYHSHPVNVAIHIFCVPLLVWSALVMTTMIPSPSFLPSIRYALTSALVFDLNTSALIAVFYLSYYALLDPVATALYAPQMILTLLSATAFATQPNGIRDAFIVHVTSWIAQFIGHGFAERRAPALLDNIVGAFVLAPFFVHLELLFRLGYREDLQKQLQNDVGKEITRIRREQIEKRKAAEKKAN